MDVTVPPAGGSFASVLAGCRSLFPAALVGPAGWERLLEKAGTLPRSVIDNHFGFEFHLGEAGADADLVVAVPPGSRLSRHYVREGARAGPGSAAAALGAGFLEQAGNPESWLARSVAAVMLEYDLAGLPPGAPASAPGIFFAPRPSAPGSRDGFLEHRDTGGLLAALAAVAGWSGRDGLLREVERVFAALPEAACVFQAGVLPSRSPRAVRLVVEGVSKEEAPALLERLRWPGPPDAAADALAAVDGLAARFFVSLDVTARGPGPRLGLELYRPPWWFAADRVGWRPLIARIEEQGWCLPAKADGLRRWPGFERLLGDGEMCRVRQGINHVKVVVERGARTVAKGYVGMGVRPYGAELRPPPAACESAVPASGEPVPGPAVRRAKARDDGQAMDSGGDAFGGASGGVS